MGVNRMRASHPGEILREEFMAPSGLNVNALAQALNVPATRLHDNVKQRGSITAATARRLARYFGEDPESWLILQCRDDPRRTVLAVGEQIEVRLCLGRGYMAESVPRAGDYRVPGAWAIR
jgi:antitoxin HigA-1